MATFPVLVQSPKLSPFKERLCLKYKMLPQEYTCDTASLKLFFHSLHIFQSDAEYLVRMGSFILKFK